MAIRPPANPASAAPARPKFGAPGGPVPQAPLPMGFQAPVAAPTPAPAFQPPPAAVAPPGAAASAMGVDIFDIPAEDFNPAAEAAENFIPNPPDDGDHVVELALSENRQEGPIREISWERKDKDSGQMKAYGAISLSLVATITNDADPFNGRRVYFDVNSFSKKATGVEGSTNDIALLLNALGEQPTGRGKTDAYRVQELVKAGYNKCIVSTEWHANFPYDKDDPASKKKSKRPYKVGQENFPRDEAGVPQPLQETPSGEPLRTIAVPIGFKRLTS